MVYILVNCLQAVPSMQTILLRYLPDVMGYKDLTFEKYGTEWNIRFNPTKSQLITYGGPNTSTCGIHINGKPIHWVNKMKYLGVYFLCNTGLTDITDSVRKFCGKFSNIMAVLNKHSNEMSTLHLVKSYCLPALLYGCLLYTSPSPRD